MTVQRPNRFIPIEPVQKPAEKTPVRDRGSVRDGGRPEFAQILEQELSGGGVQFSAHARTRLEQRNIEIRPGDLEKLNSAVQEIARKGGRNSVVYYRDIAFVTNVPNRTVITAIPVEDEMQVLTNIDSAVTIR